MEDIVTELRAKIAATQQELAEVTRERDDYKQAVYDLGLTPEEARAGAKRSRDMKQQLLATQAKLLESELHAARLVEVLKECQFALEPYDDVKPRDWKTDREKLARAHQSASAALSTPINLDELAKNQKPIGWLYTDAYGTHYTDDKREWYDVVGIEEVTPLYTRPFVAAPADAEYQAKHLQLISKEVHGV